MGARLGASNMVLQQKSAAIASYLGHRLGPAAGRPGSMGFIYSMMEQQSALMAYVDVFRWTALLAFFCAGAVWLFKKPIKPGGPPQGMH
jgi:DHA2 family multidrug resistance protein